MGSPGEEVLTPKADEPSLREGHYAAKQIFCRDRMIAWSHRRRYEVGVRLARQFQGRRILDYGCGDGTFLAMLYASDAPPASAVGAEIDEFQVNDCRARLGHLPGMQFDMIARLDDAGYRGAFDGVICMEVLEHVVDLEPVIERLWRVLSDSGTLIVSVPVETGAPLLLKQAARRIAGWRGIGQYSYTSAYTVREYAASVFAGGAQQITRPIYNTDGGGHPFHDHKGFNWKALRDRLSRRFSVDRIVASPLPWLGPRLATQVWFVARKKTV